MRSQLKRAKGRVGGLHTAAVANTFTRIQKVRTHVVVSLLLKIKNPMERKIRSKGITIKA